MGLFLCRIENNSEMLGNANCYSETRMGDQQNFAFLMATRKIAKVFLGTVDFTRNSKLKVGTSKKLKVEMRGKV